MNCRADRLGQPVADREPYSPFAVVVDEVVGGDRGVRAYQRADPALCAPGGEVPEVVEADLNPVRCMTNGCVVLDMRLRIERQRRVERVKTW